MLELYAVSAALTLVLTRAVIVRIMIHTPLLRITPEQHVDTLDDFLRCPMCTGFWITAGAASAHGASLSFACLAYLGVVLTCALYDFLISREP